MRNISDTINRLSALQMPMSRPAMPGGGGRLTALDRFGANPGNLNAYTYVPPALAEGAALVVVLHGCTQTAAGYDTGAGWSQMADRHGFAVLFAEQKRQNNPNLCFNWFDSDDNRWGFGEAQSICEMIAATAAANAIDPARIFITGLSAGGAMASVMLAAYPEIFAGGAIIAGLPYGCANTVPQAFDRMRGHGMPAQAELAMLVRDASDHAGPWPAISIWHGSGDATVAPANADAIVRQWRSLHAVDAEPSRLETVDGQQRRVWRDADGRDVIEAYSIAGMGHGTPLDTIGADGCGVAGPFLLEAGISSTRHICRFWNLVAADAPGAGDPHLAGAKASLPAPSARQDAGFSTVAKSANRDVQRPSGVKKVIEDALRAAGLMQ